MYPKPSEQLRALLDELALARSKKASFFGRNPVPGIVKKITDSGDVAALPCLLDIVNDSNSTIRSSAEAATAMLLPKLSAGQIMALETAIREGSADHDWGNELEATTTPGWMLSTLSKSGWRREKAVQALTKARNQDALPFILLRLNDWISKVRTEAERWFAVCISTLPLQNIVQCLPILAALGERVQAKASPIVANLLRLLEDHAAKTDLLQIIEQGEPRTRWLVLSILAKGGALASAETQQQLLAHPDPMLGVLLLKHLSADKREIPESIVLRAVASKKALLRRYALHCLSKRQVESMIPLLETLLFDGTSGVRAFAQHYLKKLLGEAALQERYQAVLDAPSSLPRALRASLVGFHECGGHWAPCDYVRWKAHPNAQVVAIAMKLFAVTHFEEALPWVRSSFLDIARPAASKAAAEVLQRHPSALLLAEIEAWLSEDHANDRIYRRAMILVSARGKWEKLPLLLRSLRHSSAVVRRIAAVQLEVWLMDFNTSQVQPTRTNIDSALTELSLAGAYCDRRQAMEFSSLLKSLHV